MAMVCPRCTLAFDQRLHCPECGVRLIYQPMRCPPSGRTNQERQESKIPWAQFLIGLLMAQGVYYVLRKLLAAGVLAAVPQESASVWATLTSLLILQGLQVLSVFSAGLLIGAGHQRGMLLGASVGVWSGVLFILSQQWAGSQVATVAVFGEPILEAAFGALGGLVGSIILKPVPALAMPLTPIEPPRQVIRLRSSQPAFAGPVAWGRVLMGVTVVVGGVVWSDVIREFVLEASNGKLKIDTHLQAELVTWEISALAMLAGASLAGASTLNGLTQGLCVGFGSGVVLLGIRLANSGFSMQMAVLTVAGALCLGLAGGWFGSQLVPPLVLATRKKRLLPTG